MFRNIVLLVLVSCLGAQLAAAETFVSIYGVEPDHTLEPEVHSGTSSELDHSIFIRYLACKAPYVMLVVNAPRRPDRVDKVGYSIVIHYDRPAVAYSYTAIAKTPSCGV